ncbi:MAG: hypothetical protein M4579_005000 [Chaenotheca gracillima]|nr:MAG: hypothetical protein M4579_005000 [Chaenotheca gracillima]
MAHEIMLREEHTGLAREEHRPAEKEDAKVMSGDGHNHSFGGEFSAPVLSVAGVAIPTPLDPSIGASTARDSIHLNSVIVPGETVFAIHYSQVRLQKRRRKDIAASEDYALHSKATWTPLWEMRGAPRRDWAEDESDDDDDDDYNEELEQPLGSEEVWVADLADEEESEEEDEEEVGEEDDGEDEEEREMNEKKLHGGTTHPKSSA